ncbi:MAG: 4Fe-4S dicluster domain-containing protein [Dehalococcoidales bacterium]|nr:4Fe-4S dicluster domain-containing protein [Dehalococcoidales bacterium]
MAPAKRIVLHFPKRLVNRPLVSRLAKDYNLDFNILKASVTQESEGVLVLEVTGKKEDFEKGIAYLNSTGVSIQPLSQDVVRNEERCTHCGACITVCPAEAFELEKSTHKVLFHDKKCIACGLCIKTCPPRAMELHF